MKQNNADDKQNDQTATHADDIPIIPDQPQRNQGQPVRDPSSNAQNEELEHIRWAEKWMVRLTAALVVASLASLGTAILQWRSSENQGVDTHNLAVAAGKQSDAAGDQVDAGNNFADSAEEINRGIAGAVTQLTIAAKNARDSIQTAQQLAQEDRRPWVGLQDFRCDGCTSSSSGDAEAVTIGNMFGIMENTGKTPAVEMIVNAVLIDRKASAPVPDYDSILRESHDPYVVPSWLRPDEAARIGKIMEITKRFTESPPIVLPP